MDSSLALAIITVIISFIALIVSILVAWSNRKTLDVNMSDNLEVVDGGRLFFIEDDSNALPYGDCLIGTIEVVNPSAKDIAFFDMRAFDPKTNLNIPFLTQRAMLKEHKDKILYRALERKEEVSLVEQLVPETNYGIFKSNSFSRFHIIIFPERNAEKIALNFKVAMKAKVKDPFAMTSRKRFRFYGTVYTIVNWIDHLKPLEQEEQKKED